MQAEFPPPVSVEGSHSTDATPGVATVARPRTKFPVLLFKLALMVAEVLEATADGAVTWKFAVMPDAMFTGETTEVEALLVDTVMFVLPVTAVVSVMVQVEDAGGVILAGTHATVEIFGNGGGSIVTVAVCLTPPDVAEITAV